MKTINFNTLLFITVIICSCSKPINTIDTRIDNLINQMTIEEKIGQTALRGTSSRVKGGLSEDLKEAVRNGEIGAILNVMDVRYVKELQQIAVEESRLGIPLIFARDVIHGFKTIFPIPIGLAASWNEQVAYDAARVSAVEATSVGIRWTFAPMLDISRDSRWGRVAESPGEDPFLASILAKAYIHGFQGDSLSHPTSMAACAKHFLGYGAAIGGRDYNTVNIPEPLLHNVYLPPFKSAFEAGVVSVMSAFNELNGIPASGNEFLLKKLLRDDCGFDGFVVSDWNSVTEMIPHGFASDEKHAALLSAKAGLDMEMTSEAYAHHLKNLIGEGVISEEALDDMVRNILKVKFKLGLFEQPYIPEGHPGKMYDKAHLESAKQAAEKSMVLLKNKSNVLPLVQENKLLIVGPLADGPHEQLGTWTFDGESNQTITPVSTFISSPFKTEFISGLEYSRDISESQFEHVIASAKKSDVILFIGGEEAILSGEAHSRSDIRLPGKQELLIKQLSALGKPIVLVIMAGRPIDISGILDDVDAALMAWHLGTMGGPALYDVLTGVSEPEGRLPITWPKSAGQLPLFYNHKNTGRPASEANFVHIDSIPVGAWQSSLGNASHYLDVGYLPQFPFGYGLSYSQFEYSNLKLSSSSINQREQLQIQVTVNNIGDRDGVETVQLYVQDITGSITRPIRELKGFKKISIPKGTSQVVKFTLNPNQLKFVNNELKHVLEEGGFNVFVGPNSAEGLMSSFDVQMD
ncbi:glycosyl hydrolase [Labilibacter sediminis]|nr:glycosyl hydrolase [Labilibacter sediminis]